MDNESALSIVLFSGTDDRLSAAAILTAGAAAMGRPVNVFLQYWAVDSFRKGRVTEGHGVAPEAGLAGAKLVHEATRGPRHWSETFRQAKELGEVRISACALSMELFGITQADLDPLVDGIEGVASFVGDAAGGPITFI